MKITVSVFTFLILISVTSYNCAYAQEFEHQLKGRPMAKASCEVEGCTHEILLPEDRSKSELVITREGDNYSWASRENRKLILSHGPNFINYIAVENAAGYIRTAMVNGICLYVEHLTSALKSVTYWGQCESS